MNRLPAGYQSVGVLNFALAYACLSFVISLLASSFDGLSAVRVLGAVAAALTGLGLVCSGVGLLRSGPGAWRLARVLLLLLAPVLVVAGIGIAWAAISSHDALGGVAVFFVAAPLLVWSLVVAITGWSLRGHIVKCEGVPKSVPSAEQIVFYPPGHEAREKSEPARNWPGG